jgi:ADP-ribose pyrophosphatase YjhB (NUDIX family)
MDWVSLVSDNPINDFPTPFASVDLVLVSLIDDGLGVLLPKRDREPFLGIRALPGGYVHIDEDDDTFNTARRVAREKLGVDVAYLEQLYTFSGRARDPRGWSISVSYLGLVAATDLAEQVRRNLVPVGRIPRLPFDHNEIVAKAIQRLHDKSTYSSLPAFLLPHEFTLNDLRELYERITGEPIDRANFRRHIVDVQKLVVPTGGRRRGLPHRPAEFFRLSDSALRNFGKPVF